MKDPPSPRTKVCRIDEASGWCVGRRRTLDEIADWPMMTAQQKYDVLDALSQRSVQ